MFIASQEGPIAKITINRPQALNTLTPELVLQLTGAIRDWSSKQDVRVIILTGSGDKAFVGGVDVHVFSDLDPDGAEQFITNLHRCFLAIRQSEKIIIAAVNGFALGGGLEMAAACDLRIASDRAQFGMPEVKVGLPSVIEAAYLPRLIGLGRAAEMVYMGDMIDAGEAERIWAGESSGSPRKIERSRFPDGPESAGQWPHGHGPAEKARRPVGGPPLKRCRGSGNQVLPRGL